MMAFITHYYLLYVLVFSFTGWSIRGDEKMFCSSLSVIGSFPGIQQTLSVVPLLSHVQLCNLMDCSTPCFPVLHHEFAQTHVHWVSDAIHPSCPLSSLFPPTFSFSQHQGFSNESVLHIRWLKYWSFSFSLSPSSECSVLISFMIDWLDLRAVQGTLQNLLQHHSSKPSILWHSAFFMVQLSYPYMTTGRTIGLTIWAFVGKVMSLLFNMPSRFVTAFLPSSKASN